MIAAVKAYGGNRLNGFWTELKVESKVERGHRRLLVRGNTHQRVYPPADVFRNMAVPPPYAPPYDTSPLSLDFDIPTLPTKTVWLNEQQYRKIRPWVTQYHRTQERWQNLPRPLRGPIWSQIVNIIGLEAAILVFLRWIAEQTLRLGCVTEPITVRMSRSAKPITVTMSQSAEPVTVRVSRD